MMQLVNNTDKKIKFAGVILAPHSSQTLHKSFISDEDLENVTVKGNMIIFEEAPKQDDDVTDDVNDKLTDDADDELTDDVDELTDDVDDELTDDVDDELTDELIEALEAEELDKLDIKDIRTIAKHFDIKTGKKTKPNIIKEIYDANKSN